MRTGGSCSERPLASPLPRALGQVRTSRAYRSPVLRFLVVGGASTALYLAVYALLRLALPAQPANLVALLATGDVNTRLNRRWSFSIPGSASTGELTKGVLAYLVSLVTTSGALALLPVVGASGRVAELVALVVANVVAGVAHYVLLRSWAFRGR